MRNQVAGVTVPTEISRLLFPEREISNFLLGDPEAGSVPSQGVAVLAYSESVTDD